MSLKIINFILQPQIPGTKELIYKINVDVHYQSNNTYIHKYIYIYIYIYNE